VLVLLLLLILFDSIRFTANCTRVLLIIVIYFRLLKETNVDFSVG